MLRVYSLMHLQHVWSKPMDVIQEEPQLQHQLPLSSEETTPSLITRSVMQEDPGSFEEAQLVAAELVETMYIESSQAATDIDDLQDIIMLSSPPPSHGEEEDEQHKETLAKGETSVITVAAIEEVVEEPQVPAAIAEVQQEEEIIPVPTAVVVAEVAPQEEIIPAPAAIVAEVAHQEEEVTSTPAAVVDQAVRQVEKKRFSVVSMASVPEEEPMNKSLPMDSPVHDEFMPKQSNKRDSKISTSSRDSAYYQEESLKKTTAFASRARTFDEPEPACPSAPIPIFLKPSRSSQIQAKVATQRKRLSLKLKRAFSVSSNAN